MLLAEEIANEKAEKEIRGRSQQQVIHTIANTHNYMIIVVWEIFISKEYFVGVIHEN